MRPAQLTPENAARGWPSSTTISRRFNEAGAINAGKRRVRRRTAPSATVSMRPAQLTPENGGLG